MSIKNLFKKSTPIANVEVIHSLMIQSYTTHMKLIMDNNIDYNNIIPERIEYLREEMKKYEKLNLENSKNYNLLEEEFEKYKKIKDLYIKYKNLVKDISLIQNNIYKDVIYIPLSDYIAILKKYNLCSSHIKNYIGVIPEKNVEEISNIINNFSKERFGDNIPKSLYSSNSPNYINRVNISKNLPKEHIKYIEEILSIYPFTLDNIFNLFPKDKNNKNYYIRTYYNHIHDYGDINISHIDNSHSDLFISAPKQDFKNLVEIRITDKVIDPFVFQPYREFGVFVYTKWGEESEDDIIKYWKEKIDTSLLKIN